jgi:hypothetical protein|tara:strand:+ start:378 stop:902 length:525 start_codon:yes stop_codon:yes gene_type:complete
MKGNATDWKSSLKRPSMPLSASSMLLGLWALILTMVNIMFGAYSPGKKILWSGFIFSGDSNTSNLDIVLGDLIFGIFALSLCIIGWFGMSKSVGGNDKLSDSIKSNFGIFLNYLFSIENGISRSVASWLILIGIIFYFSWSVLFNTWVDVGIYSVMIALVSSGIGIHILAAAES